MAVYFRPKLAHFLRQDCAEKLDVRDEVPLGEMPLRLDLLIIRRDPDANLPFPMCHLGAPPWPGSTGRTPRQTTTPW